MAQPDSRIMLNKPLASRSPSPDTIMNHPLIRTQPLEVKSSDKRRQKVPLIQEMLNLTKENLVLKQLLANDQSAELRRRLQGRDREISELKKQLAGDKDNRRLFVTLTDPIHSSVRNSTERKRPLSHVEDEEREQVVQLRKKVLELGKDNEQLRRSLLSRLIRVSDIRDMDLNKAKKQVIGNLTQKMLELQRHANQTIRNLEEKIQHLERVLRGEDSLVRSSQKISLVSSVKRGSTTAKRQGQKYSTPSKEEITSNLEAQLTVSKNNIVQLQREIQVLHEQNAQLKKAYDDLLRKSHYSNSSDIRQLPRPRSFQTQSQLNQLLLQNQSLKDTLQSLRNNLQRHENQNHELRVKLSAFDRRKDVVSQTNTNASLNEPRPELDQLKSRNREQERMISQFQRNLLLITKERDAIKNQLFSISGNNHRFQEKMRALQDQNIGLKEENQLLRGNITDLSISLNNIKAQIASTSISVTPQPSANRGNSKLDQIWNELIQARKSIEQLQLRNKQLEKQVQMKGMDTTSTILKLKQQQISKLKEELKRALDDQKNRQAGQNDELKRQVGILKGKLTDADKILQHMGNIDSGNKREIEGMLISLEELKKMLQRISFQHLEASLRQVSHKYKSIIEERIQILRSLKEKSRQHSRLSFQNQRLKRESVDLNSKYINQRSQRQQLEGQVQQQTQEARILKQQIRQLNNTLNQYVNMKIEVKSTEESRVRELEAEIVEDHTERNVAELRDIESQVRMVSAKLQDLMKKVVLLQYRQTILTELRGNFDFD